eukprot:4739851-Prymnesium_polylepis.1
MPVHCAPPYGSIQRVTHTHLLSGGTEEPPLLQPLPPPRFDCGHRCRPLGCCVHPAASIAANLRRGRRAGDVDVD